MNTPCSSPRWQRRKDARPSEITSAALALFIQKGFAATKLDEVARAAGVTKGTLYLYFSSKEELFKAAIRETLIPSIQMAEEFVADSKLSATEMLTHLMEKWVELIVESPANGISKLVVAEAGNFPDLANFYLNEVMTRVRKVFGEVLERGIQAGEFRPMHLGFAIKEIISPVILQTIWHHTFSPYGQEAMDLGEFTRFHLSVVLKGIQAAPDNTENQA